MPQWVKILLISFVVFVVLVVAGSALIARKMMSTYESFEQNVNASSDAGKEFGRSATLDRCVEEVVRRSGGAENPMALMATTPFAWSCLEAAPYDRSFCSDMPAVENEPALRSWAAQTCREHGVSSNNELCPMALTPVASFCSTKRS